MRRYRPGERIVTEGEAGTDIMVLMSGSVSVWRGRTELARLKGQGDVLGELAALTGRPRSASIVALTDAEILRIRVDLKTFARRHPEILAKIDAAIVLRFEIARNKARIYIDEAAKARRILLHELIVRKEVAHSQAAVKDLETQMRRGVRRRLEEEFDLHQGADDPRVLARIADDNGVLSDFNAELQKQSWLEAGTVVRFEETESRFRLVAHEQTFAAVRERAAATVDMLDLLNEFEAVPGIARLMDMAKLETVVPLETRIKVLRDACLAREADADDRRIKFIERRVAEVVEKQKVSAGRDTVPISRAAREMGVYEAYEESLRRIIEVSDTRSTFVDIVPVT